MTKYQYTMMGVHSKMLLTMPYYAKAPIVEAVIDIQTRFDEQPEIAKFEAFQTHLAEQFPRKDPIQLLRMGLNQPEKDSGWETNIDHSVSGLRLSNADNSRVLQLQRMGFTYSHMPPYTSWDVFRSEARRLWEIFVETCRPVAVTRCAVRFINRIDIPSERAELSSYFQLCPNIPPDISQEVNGMFMQLQMPQRDLSEDSVAIINLAMTEPTQPNQVSILLDFDVFQVGEIDPNSEVLWEVLDRFRSRKNFLFEACITDNTRSLIK